MAFTEKLSAAQPDRKPRFALVADFVGSDTAYLHEELKEVAEVRYIQPSNQFDLRQFNANGGRIVLWTDHSSHEVERKLKAQGVSYKRFSGTLAGLAAAVKAAIAS